MEPYVSLGDFINGRFIRTNKPDGEWEAVSPADKKDRLIHVVFKMDHVDEACRQARRAFRDWSTLSSDSRATYLRRLRELFISHESEMVEILSRESGKPGWEALTEVQAIIHEIDVTLSHSLTLVSAQKIESPLPNASGRVYFRPRGVMAVVGPFSLSGSATIGHIIPALATGNTVVFKPSELTPVIGQFLAQMFEKAEFPPGVFNLIQGKGETGRRLVCNEDVEGILFTGSYQTGLKIKQDTLNHFWKTLALEMGSKNASVVWSDADLDKAVYDNLVGSFISSGQRCWCTSRLILHRAIADQFVEKFYSAAKKLSIGHWSEAPFMGPLISMASVENYVRFQGIAAREGAETVMRGKLIEASREGNYVSPSIYRIMKPSPDSVYQKTEIFGPNVAIYTVDDFDEALAVNNSSSYGLAMSLFTTTPALYEEARARARVGLVNWNCPTTTVSPRLPLGGLGKSGNDRPSGQFSVYYCTAPVGCIEDSSKFDRFKVLPGITLE